MNRHERRKNKGNGKSTEKLQASADDEARIQMRANNVAARLTTALAPLQRDFNTPEGMAIIASVFMSRGLMFFDRAQVRPESVKEAIAEYLDEIQLRKDAQDLGPLDPFMLLPGDETTGDLPEGEEHLKGKP